MIYRTLLPALLLTASFVMPAIAATPSSLQGDVRGTDGRPVASAQVRIERKDKMSPIITTTTDSRGHYATAELSIGLYRINVVTDRGERSGVDIRTAERAARVDFDLAPKAGKKVKHYVWMSANTGSHIGGRWVEVADSSAVAGTWNVDRQSAELARELLRHQNNSQRF
jgi:hypothetical protein